MLTGYYITMYFLWIQSYIFDDFLGRTTLCQMYRDFAQIGEKFCIVHFPVVKWNKVPTTSIVVEEALLKFCSTHYYMQFILKFFIYVAVG